jgi:transketolase
MRNAFADELTKLAAADPRLVLLSGDIGNKLFDGFKEVDAARFFNCGVAEANMMGVAAGMALCGLRPFIYTIAPFTTTRCFEQIRIDACYHDVPVVIVGTGSGLSYAELGPTHHSLEDMAILRTLPGMRVLAPCDATELRLTLRAVLDDDRPTYIRIGKKGEPTIHETPPSFRIGEAIVIRPGDTVALLCAGNMMSETLRAAEQLGAHGISAEVVSFHTVKPLDTAYLERAAKRFRLIVTVEEHSRIGGFGSAVAEWRTTSGSGVRQMMFGTDDVFVHEVGSQRYVRNRFGLTGENISELVRNALNEG